MLQLPKLRVASSSLVSRSLYESAIQIQGYRTKIRVFCGLFGPHQQFQWAFSALGYRKSQKRTDFVISRKRLSVK